MNVDGSGLVNLTNASSSADFFPNWSADGSQVGFTSDRDGNAEIYVMNADGSNQTRLTKIPADSVHPRWSPDSKQIVFAHGPTDGRYEIYLMKADGSDPSALTDSPGALDNNFGARWSADGMQIIFWSERDGDAELYVMNADGSAQTRLTDNPADDVSPDWSP